MHCFYHPDTPAVGICKNCSRGLCRQCTTEFEAGLACKNRCEEAVQAIAALILRNTRLSPSAATPSKIAALFLTAVGLLFVVMGLVAPQGPWRFPLLFGLIMIVIAVLYYLLGRRIQRS